MTTDVAETASREAGSTLEPPAFDPFRVVPYLRRMERWPSWPLLLILPFVGSLLLIASRLEGTLGSGDDFQPIADTRRAFGIRNTPVSDPSFPVLRDFSNIYLIIVVCLTIPLIHWQWRLMRSVVPVLRASGVLIIRATPRYTLIHKIFGLKRTITRNPSVDPVEAYLARVNALLDKLGRSSGLMVAVSFVLALLLTIGPNRNGLFRAFAGRVPEAEMSGWLSTAYGSWWGSIAHPAGFLMYVLLMTLGIFLVLIQNTVGLMAVYSVNALKAVAEYELDWLNRDGNYGWQSVAATYRTVILSLLLHGSALSISLLALGTENVPWVFALVLVWAIMLPSVTIGPRLAFRGLSETSRRTRIERLTKEWQKRGLGGVEEEEALRARIEAIRSVQARPLRLRSAEIPAFAILVLLPMFLTAVQVYFSIRYGG